MRRDRSQEEREDKKGFPMEEKAASVSESPRNTLEFLDHLL
jgi:hypothetical protein